MSEGEGTEFLEFEEFPRIPDVEIRGELGRGGMGVVYRGRQSFLDREVAVKVLGDISSKGEAFARRFQREAKILAGMTHPNIVGCYQAGTTDDGQSYIVMEFIDGPNLQEHLESQGKLDPCQAVRLCRDVATALDHAYQSRIIHRDVKPENVLLRRVASGSGEDFPYQVKLADLGLARSTENDTGNLQITQQGQVFGTPSTMAPEQFDDPDGVDHRADMYGLGCVVYHAVTGQIAYSGRTLREIITRKSATLAPDPRHADPAVPASVATLVTDLLAYERDDRPSTYAELIARCDQIITELQSCGSAGGSDRRKLVRNLGMAGAAVVGVVVAAVIFLGANPESPGEDRGERTPERVVDPNPPGEGPGDPGEGPGSGEKDPEIEVPPVPPPVKVPATRVALSLSAGGRVIRSDSVELRVESPTGAGARSPSERELLDLSLEVSDLVEREEVTLTLEDLDGATERSPGESWRPGVTWKITGHPALESRGESRDPTLSLVAPEARASYTLRVEGGIDGPDDHPGWRFSLPLTITAVDDPPILADESVALLAVSPGSTVALDRSVVSDVDTPEAELRIDYGVEPEGLEVRGGGASPMLFVPEKVGVRKFSLPARATLEITATDGTSEVSTTRELWLHAPGTLWSLDGEPAELFDFEKGDLSPFSAYSLPAWGMKEGSAVWSYNKEKMPRVHVTCTKPLAEQSTLLPAGDWSLTGRIIPLLDADPRSGEERLPREVGLRLLVDRRNALELSLVPAEGTTPAEAIFVASAAWKVRESAQGDWTTRERSRTLRAPRGESAPLGFRIDRQGSRITLGLGEAGDSSPERFLTIDPPRGTPEALPATLLTLRIREGRACYCSFQLEKSGGASR